MMMRNMSLFCMLALVSVPLALAGTDSKTAPTGFAVTPPATAAAPVANLSVQEIVDKNVAARGGLKAWRGVQAMAMTGKMDAGRGVQLPFRMEMKRPRKSRLEIEFQGKTAVQVFDGTKGWKLRPYLNRKDIEPFTADEMKVAAQQQELDGPLVDYSAKGTKVDFAGVEQVKGRDAYKLKLTLKGGTQRLVWVDAQSFLDVKIDGSRRLDGKTHPVATYFLDYRSREGVMVPYTLETTVEGVNGSEKVVFESVVLNPKLDDSRFSKPQ
jgi:outer membrane lipoprotein-sorting protein